MGDLWNAIVDGMAALIKIFASVGGNNTAIGIILFTITIRLLILPLTLKSVRSGRSMQALQPYIKEINERYKVKAGQRLPPEKAQAKQAEIMTLYKEYGVNPLASCFPILIQLPIFFAVYGAVTRSIGTADPFMQFAQDAWNQFAPGAATASKEAGLQNTSFLWISDLRKPDPTYILPVLMVAFQFITQRMTIPKGGGADETQRRMNSILQWMPLIFGITALNFPTGPVLYWVTTSIFSTVQQYFITGFQSLTDIPGLGFLPVKEIKLPQLEKKAALPATNPDGTPRKKTLMERLAEQQEKIQTDKAKTGETATETTSASADAGRPAPTANNFGRRAGAGPLTSKNASNENAFGAPSNPARQLGRPPKKAPSNEGRSNNKGKK